MKKKGKKKIVWFGIIFLMGLMILHKTKSKLSTQTQMSQSILPKITENKVEIPKSKKEITDWKLVLVNFENSLPDDFAIDLVNIDKTRKFDSRAIQPLNEMLQAMKNDGITNIWVQSAYRSMEHQKEVFERKVKQYENQGKPREEAEKLVLQTINKPGKSEHNLGLAVDFNYVDYQFDETAGFVWLKENAETYGFILRYTKEKENITKVDYEPWHWRYVGKEHAVKMNEMGMCLEEYVEYLESQE